MEARPIQLDLPHPDFQPQELINGAEGRLRNHQANRLDPKDRSIHDWYRFVLSFPPHLVRHYLEDFELDEKNTVLDPFCGTGTTLVESKLNRIRAVGVEANPFAQFASSVKLDWSIDPQIFAERANQIAKSALARLQRQGIDDNWGFNGNSEDRLLKELDSDANRLLLSNSISPLPLHKALILLECLRNHEKESYYRHALLALAKALVFRISNLKFGPEVGVGKPKPHSPVVSFWLSEVKTICEDLETIRGAAYPECRACFGDAREIGSVMRPNSVDAVITSPPYPNEKDYTRTTRLESVILGFISNKSELRGFKKRLLRSNTRGVYKGDDDDHWIAGNTQIERIANEIEKRRKQLGKTSGFERLYPAVTRLYFGGMAKHLAGLRTVLRKGARLAYVVGDQASYLRIMIRTGTLLAEIAQSLGYELIRIDLFRTRFSTATGEQLREEVVVLRWPGNKGSSHEKRKTKKPLCPDHRKDFPGTLQARKH